MRGLWQRLVAFGFRLLYNELAFTYDLVSYVVSLGDWRAWQYAALMELPPAPAHILELAHGTGHLHKRLLEDGYTAIGGDISQAMGRITRGRLLRVGLPVRLLRLKGQALPFADKSFDAIVCTFPTNFIFQSETLNECRRVLRPEGRLVLVLNGVLTRKGPVERLIDGAYAATGQRGESSYENMLGWIREHGFRPRLVQVASPRGFAELLVAETENIL